MAIHSDLTIYKEAHALFVLAMKVSKNMPRDLKPLIGSKLRDECMEILQSTQDANSVSGTDRVSHIDALHSDFTALRF